MSPKLLNILLILIPVVIYFGYIDPFYTGQPGIIWTPETSISGLQAKNVQYFDALHQVELVKSGMEKLSKDYLAIDEVSKEKAIMLLPDSINDVKLRNEVVAVAAKAGIAISGLKVDKNTTQLFSKDLEGYSVSFTMKANYSTFKKFMEMYEKSMRLFILDSVKITKTERKEGEITEEEPDMLNISVRSLVYYLK